MIVQTFFEVNLGLIYFIYSLIFFLMGFAILIKNRVHSRFNLAKSLKYLAYFGIVHGIADLGLFFIPIQSSYLSAEWIHFLEGVQVIVNGLSFYFLLMFGVHLLYLTKSWSKKVLYVPIFLFSLWFASFILLQPIFVHEGNQEWWFAISDIWSRYLLAFPGGLLACWGLLSQKAKFKENNVESMIKTLQFAGLVMAVYAIVGGLIVQYAPMLPTILFNSDLFFTTLGFPIEILRGLVGLFMSVSIIRILKVFDLEYQVYLYHAEKTQALNEERNRIARDLHDGTIQSIYALGLQLEGMKHHLLKGFAIHEIPLAKRAEEDINNFNQRINGIIKEIRTYIKDLKHPLDTNITMTDEIQRLVNDLKIKNHVALYFHNDFTGESPSLSVSIQVYYIVKESLTNILKHAEATEVHLSVKGNSQNFEITIADNGKGFDKNNFLNLGDSSLYHHGVKNMKYRAKIINGNLEIKSMKNEGTIITLVV
ncbi:histidine kinase [Bacillus sp. B15-48]|uniref:sensor histidine kinase n=1 Tax=Bacillus sp. B15-48 TaxID=1548601 RepID=UPI00193F76AC|nr:histidine kinase [Bacillus sp. B15-48]MBM4764735.1 hypothetical protein [Bacillus sp. B15-48]